MAINQFIRTRRTWTASSTSRRRSPTPRSPLRMLPAYDSGDHLHPNDAGMKALADAVTWLDEPSIPISRPSHHRRRGGARDAGADARHAAVLRRRSPRAWRTTTAPHDRHGDQHRRRRDAHGLRPRPPDQRDVLARRQPLQVTISKTAWTGPVANEAVTLGFAQHVDADRRAAHRRLLEAAHVHVVDDHAVGAPAAGRSRRRGPSRPVTGVTDRPRSCAAGSRCGPCRRLRRRRSATARGS